MLMLGDVGADEGTAGAVVSFIRLHIQGGALSVTLDLRREQFVACTRSVARGHVRRERDKAEVVGNNKAFGSQTGQP
jgi:hypothetical protein